MTPQEQQVYAYLRQHPGAKLAEIGAVIGTTKESVRNRLKRLRDKGFVDWQHGTPGSVYACDLYREREWRILEMIADGYTDAEIADTLQVSLHIVHYHTWKHGSFNAVRRQHGVYSAQDVMQLFDVSKNRVHDWMRWQWLRSRQRRVHSPHYTDDAAILEFLMLRLVWPEWTPERITDPDLRSYALRLRAGAGGEWLDKYQIAERLCVAPRTVTGMIVRGDYPCIRLRNRNYVWSGLL